MKSKDCVVDTLQRLASRIPGFTFQTEELDEGSQVWDAAFRTDEPRLEGVISYLTGDEEIRLMLNDYVFDSVEKRDLETVMMLIVHHEQFSPEHRAHRGGLILEGEDGRVWIGSSNLL